MNRISPQAMGALFLSMDPGELYPVKDAPGEFQTTKIYLIIGAGFVVLYIKPLPEMLVSSMSADSGPGCTCSLQCHANVLAN